LAITGGFSMAVMIFKVPPTLFNIDIEHPFKQSGPADAGRSRWMERIAVFICWPAGNDHGT